MEMKYDKINNDVAFIEEGHKYINVKFPDRQYTSITTLIGKYHEKFNEEFMSRYKALEALSPNLGVFLDLKKRTKMTTTQLWKDEYLDICGVDKTAFDIEVASLLNKWKQINEEACEIGTATHLEKEDEWYDNPDALLRKRLPNLDEEEQTFPCIRHDFDLSRDQAIMPEYLVYYSCPDNILHLAGQVDLIVKNGNKISILDYKTNKKGIETKAFFNPKTKQSKKMFYPISNLDDTMMNHYTLQLSIYAWMLQKINPDFTIELLRLIHIDREGKETEFTIPYLKDEVERLLLYHKKILATEHFRSLSKV